MTEAGAPTALANGFTSLRANQSSPAPAPARTITLCTGPTADLLLGLTRSGNPLEPYKTEAGWDHYQWEGLDGGLVTGALPSATHPGHCADAELAAETLRWAPTTDRSYPYLDALLSGLLRLDGLQRQWHWCGVTRTLYGDKAHPDRHNKPVRGLLAVLVHGRWNLGSPPSSRRRRGAGSSATPAGRQLVEFTDRTRSSGTVRLEKAFRAELEAHATVVEANEPWFAHPGVPNPHGHNPSRPMRSRMRLSAVRTCARPPGDGPAHPEVSLEALAKSSGADLQRIIDRRHAARWGLELLADLKKAVEHVGVGLVSFADGARSVLKFPLQLGSRLELGSRGEGRGRDRGGGGSPGLPPRHSRREDVGTGTGSVTSAAAASRAPP